MNCPRCGSFLREIEYENMHIHTCDSCGAEVIGPDELRNIVETRERHFPPDLCKLLAQQTPIFGTPTNEPGRAFSCPTCSKPMGLVNYGGDSGIMIDRCGECGTLFLDHEELEKIQIIMDRWQDEAPEQIRAIAGELERARREAAESASRAFAGSRFAFVNAMINRFLDAA